MLKSYDMLKQDYSHFKAPEMKIKRMTDEGKLIRLRKDLYETDLSVPGCTVAGAIRTPSYLSFEYALSRYGLIPEAVYVFTSASCRMRKRKIYQNRLGTFTYQDVPVAVFPYEIRFFEEHDRPYLMATAEKALCDRLYLLHPIRSKKELRYMLFEDLRIDEDLFAQLDFSVLKELCPLYRTTTLKTLMKLLEDYS